MFNNSLLFAINNEGKVYALSTTGSCWREFMYLGLEFKSLSAVPHFLWAVGGDRQVYLHVHCLEIPIRVKEESYENERWLPLEGFSGRLLPTDRYQFSSQDGTVDRSIDRIRLPSMAWQWEGDWQLELTLDGQPLDHDGWSYAVDFPAQFGSSKQWKSCVRRRKWIRYRKFSAMNSWCAIAPLHKDPTQEPFVDVSIGGLQMPYAPQGSLSVWAITAQGRVMYRTGVSTTSPEGLKWNNISIQPNCDVRQLSVGSSGLVWAILWSGHVLIRKGITKDCPQGESWLEAKAPNDCKLSHVSVGFNSVWTVSSESRVFYRKGIDGNSAGMSETAAMGNGWLEITGNMTHISVGLNDQVFALGASDKSIYWRSGITAAEPYGKRWRMVQANMQLSRTSSTASVVSNQKHSSLQMLNENVAELKTHVNLQHVWEESHSAPIEHTMPVKSRDKKTKDSTNHDTQLTGKSYESTLVNPRAWSPVRSVGSVVGMEAQPDSDSSVFDVDSGLYFDEDVSQTAWSFCDASWSLVEAGACFLDPLQLPNWFSDSHNCSNSDLVAKWRIDILNKLKERNNNVKEKSGDYTNAIEEKGWTRSCESRIINSNGSSEDCLVSLYWNSLECVGTLSIFNPDGTIKYILNLREITCVKTSSEPNCPRITLTVPRHHRNYFNIQFTTEMEQEDWLSLLVDVTCQVHGLSGKPSVCSIWAVTQSSDILNWDPMPCKFNSESNREYFKEFQVASKNIISGHTEQLYNQFPLGSVLEISGCLFDEIDRFHINLQGQEVKKHRHLLETEVTEVHFHFNIRFDENAVVCNSKVFGDWGIEERHPLPLKAGQEFKVKIECEKHGFQVFVNKQSYCFFEHRISSETVTSVKVQGPMKLYNMSYKTTSLIIDPEEMVWRMMGGYLKKIDSCHSDVVWGISHDHRAWVYTGGWGGGALKGLDSNDNVHTMTDTQTYCVYENQRWNPLSGYTSTGLPTDRHMWSDVTGRHKRTREHTKLLSRKWHWDSRRYLKSCQDHVLENADFHETTGHTNLAREPEVSEWMIDYNTPGGVDNEGWQYATDFPAPYHGRKLFTDCVRRRRWYRKAQGATEGPWQKAGTTALLDISLWADEDEVSLWAITLGGESIYRTGVSSATPAGIHWEHVNSPQSFIAISVRKDIVWTVGKKGELYFRDGISADTPGGTSWKLIEAPKCTIGYKSSAGVKSVSLSRNLAWVVLINGVVAVRTEVTKDHQGGLRWKYITDTDMLMKHISAGEHEVWATTNEGVALRRIGLAQDDPAGIGVSWVPILRGAAHVTVRGRPF